MPPPAGTAARSIRPGKIHWVVRGLWWFYNIGTLLALILGWPLITAVVATSVKRRGTFRQRLGCWRYPWQNRRGKGNSTIWVHALSVGEMTAAQPLVAGLHRRWKQSRILLSASTYTGYETACRLFADSGIDLAYFPYDLLFSVRSMVSRIDPAMVILMETDIWPNFIAEIQRRRIPLFLANFRMSDPAWPKWRNFRTLGTHLFGSFQRIFVQSRQDARRLESLGVATERLCVAGNLKFDIDDAVSADELATHWRQQLGIPSSRPVIVAGSTHEGEEAVLMNAYVGLRRSGIDVGLIVAPRDTGRSRDVMGLVRRFEADSLIFSQLQADSGRACPHVVVVDVMGVLKTIYSLANVAFVGGSLTRDGGHNPLEPAIMAKPILFGPDMRDFRQTAAWLLDAGAARRVSDSDQLERTLTELLLNPDTAVRMGRRARKVYGHHQGAAARILDGLAAWSREPMKREDTRGS